MASTKEYLDFVLEQLSGIDEVSCRPLFFCSKIGKHPKLIPRPPEKFKEVCL